MVTAFGTVAVAITVAALAAGCAGEPPEVTVDDEELVTGRSIYGASCASCHGADGRGGVGSRLDGASLIEAYPEIGDQMEIVTIGKHRMPAFLGRLDDDQVRAVVRYPRADLAP